jgi:hypothetical protein
MRVNRRVGPLREHLQGVAVRFCVQTVSGPALLDGWESGPCLPTAYVTLTGSENAFLRNIAAYLELIQLLKH